MNGRMSPGGSVDNTLNWSRVVRQGRPLRKINEDQLGSLKERVGDQRAAKLIIGTAAQGNIKVVRTNLVSVLPTKFTPDLDTQTLSTARLTFVLSEMMLWRCITQSSGLKVALLDAIMNHAKQGKLVQAHLDLLLVQLCQ